MGRVGERLPLPLKVNTARFLERCSLPLVIRPMLKPLVPSGAGGFSASGGPFRSQTNGSLTF